ncbi:MAG TPA: response regulator [Chitinophagaceae bacterium]|nr:response regulator [Chitinophagaceae bacterium]
MAGNKLNILYVDDEVNNLTAFKACFRRTYKIFLAETPKRAQDILDNNNIQIIISDQRMPEMTGIEFFTSIIKKHPDPIRMLLTGYSDIQAVIDAINKGKVFRYFSKPWDEDELKENIDQAGKIFMLREERKELTGKLLDENQKMEFMLRQKLLS